MTVTLPEPDPRMVATLDRLDRAMAPLPWFRRRAERFEREKAMLPTEFVTLADSRSCKTLLDARRLLSENMHSELLRELGFDAVTHVASVRAFGTGPSEQTHTPHAVMEAALAHSVRNKVEAAYARSDLFEKRRVLIKAWAHYLKS